MKISVVIPVFNEVDTIGRVIERALDCGYDAEVIVVDDASTDGTREFLQRLEHPAVKRFYHSINRGKGAALRLGFAAATNPYVFVQDADLEYDPRDFAVMLPPLIDGRADMIYGSRFLGGPHRVLFFWHFVGNRLITLISNMVLGVSKGFRKSLEIQGVGYRAAKSGEKLNLSLGYSHPVVFEAPKGITLTVEGQNKIHVDGIDKQQVGQVAAEIRSLRAPEPYKGKGIRYEGEIIRKKLGKAGKAGKK